MSTATFSHSAHFLSTVREMFAGWFDTRNATRGLKRKNIIRL